LGHAEEHQFSLAQLIRDAQYAIDHGDTIFAPRLQGAAPGRVCRPTPLSAQLPKPAAATAGRGRRHGERGDGPDAAVLEGRTSEPSIA